jgi:transcription termination factor NusB
MKNFENVHDYIVDLFGHKEAIECALENAETAFDPRLDDDNQIEDAKDLLEAVLENQASLRKCFDQYMDALHDLHVELVEGIKAAEAGVKH